MEQIGVEAILIGVQEFESDMGRIQKSIESIVPSSGILGDAMGWLGSVFSDFGEHVSRIIEVTLGVLFRDAIRGAIDGIKELVGQIIDAGNEFQTLSIRLDGINLQKQIDSGLDYSAAMQGAKKATQEQITWIQALSAATPFNSSDIANTYALARSYGFADDEAKRLTTDITDYAASMGLTSDAIVNIVQNMGQMDARGKITFTAIRNLTRSAYLPLDDVLNRIAKTMGTTTAALTAEISKPGEGVPAQLFIDAFQQMVEQGPRYIGAAGRLGRTFLAAGDNVMDLFRNIGGLNIVTPVLDVLGEHIASIVDTLVTFNEKGDLIKTDKWNEMVVAAQGVGQALSTIIGDLLDLGPAGTQFTDALINGLKGLSTWLTDNKDGIVQWVKDSITWLGGLKDKIFLTVQYVMDKWQELQLALSGGLKREAGERNAKSPWDNLVESAGRLGQAIQDIVARIMGVPQGGTFFDIILISFMNFSDFVVAHKEDIIGFITGFANAFKWIDEHKDQIADWLKALIILFTALQVIQFVASFVASLIVGFIGFVLTVGAVIGTISFLVTTIGTFASSIMSTIAVITSIGLAIIGLGLFFNGLKVIITGVGTFLAERFTSWFLLVVKSTQDIANAFLTRDWSALGMAIVNGVKDGILWSTAGLITAVVNAAKAAYNAARSYLGIRSPSTLFAGIGENMMEGMTQGIAASVGAVAGAMQSAVSVLSLPALQAPAMVASYASPMRSNSTTYQQNNSFNLQIHSQAQTEQVASDFNMMSSLAGI